MDQSFVCVDGNDAAAGVAYRLSELIAIYPITPASTMGEAADAWSADGRPNLWGVVPEVVEMQSEAGAAGVLHGAVQRGALATTFTASQGLLLMIPNMYKIAGELCPAVIHVAARAVATHALSIFGDHSDVMAARATGWVMLSSSSVQEAQDLALVAHAASLRTRLPFLHFFDGFRTSHEVAKIVPLGDDVLRALVDEEAVLAHRLRGLDPDHPVLRGSAQNPDVFFQAREAANEFYDAVPSTVQTVMDELAARTGRQYHLVDYRGAPDAERVVVIMGSGAGTVGQVVDDLVGRGEKVGVIDVHLFRPFPVDAVVDAIPSTVRTLAVLDRTKEPGSAGEPLYQDVVTALFERGRSIDVIGARYGLASKEFDPPMVKGLFDELLPPAKGRRRHVTVGIVDDVTHLSVEPDRDYRLSDGNAGALLYGLGSDGTVGASKTAVKIVAAETDLFAQGYFEYDSKKSGSMTVSHLRFGPHPIESEYLVSGASHVVCSQFHLAQRVDVLARAAEGATLLLNSPYEVEHVWDHLPAELQRTIIDRHVRLVTVDASAIARTAGLDGHTGSILLPCFLSLSGLIADERILPAVRRSLAKEFARRGEDVVARNHAAVEHAVASMRDVPVPALVTATQHRRAAFDGETTDFVRRVTSRLMAGEGDLLPVSALPPDGTFPTGTAQYERRGLATSLPVWDETLCVDCGKCAIVCAHAAIRMKVFPPDALSAAPPAFKSKAFRSKDLEGYSLAIQVAPDDCTGCAVCVDVCPAHSKSDPTHRALEMVPAEPLLAAERANWDFFTSIPELDRTLLPHDSVKGSQTLQPLFEFSGACAGCGETPYLKLLTQLFGDHLLVANATGCSSIYGGNLPTTPWASDAAGRGPAWANSLFEDNAEFGLGIRLAYERQRAEACALLAQHAAAVGRDLVDEIIESATADSSDEREIQAQRVRVARLDERLADMSVAASDPAIRRLRSITGALVHKSLWIVGGDGWAYDIGSAGLDHVLASGRNVNVLVLDTEVYSNTGGQASKSTPRGAVAKFASSGKATRKKDLGMIAATYGDVYVAQIALGANDLQATKALVEAEAWPGPSLVIAYSTCIAHGIEMSTSMSHQKDAVRSGYWPLFRFHPEGSGHEQPFQLDSKHPTIQVRDFELTEGRFATLAREDPSSSEHMLEMTQHDVDERWEQLERLASPERRADLD